MKKPIKVPQWYRRARETRFLDQRATLALYKTPVETLEAWNAQLKAEREAARRESIDRINKAQEEMKR